MLSHPRLTHRRELPPLNVGGLIQMDDPPRRSLIINGVIVMEGEAIQPGLVLERIGNGQAVLRHKVRAIQAELGDDDSDSWLEELAERLEQFNTAGQASKIKRVATLAEMAKRYAKGELDPVIG